MLLNAVKAKNPNGSNSACFQNINLKGPERVSFLSILLNFLSLGGIPMKVIFTIISFVFPY